MPKKKPPITIAVTERAVVQRLRRELAKKNHRLLVNRNEDTNGCRYYIVDERNLISETIDDLDILGRELEVLHPWERIATPEPGNG